MTPPARIRFGVFPAFATLAARTTANFSRRVSRLSAASRRSAAPRSATGSVKTSRTGRRERVYAAPFPAWWRDTRAVKSLVAPV